MTKSKFRAWHKTWEEMGKVKRIRFDDDDGNMTKVLFIGKKFGVNENIDEIELMQSTGRKDTSENEIFTGDILKVTDKHGSKESWLEVVSYNEEKAMFVTEEVNKHHKFPTTPLCDLFNTDLFVIEVIGNIYENADLVGDK